jgi:hypothetical protein
VDEQEDVNMKRKLSILIGLSALMLMTTPAFGYGFGYVYQINPDGVAHVNNWVEVCSIDSGSVSDGQLATIVDTNVKIAQENKAMQSEIRAKSNELKRLEQTSGYDQARADALDRQISELRNKLEANYKKYIDQAEFSCGTKRYWGAVITTS